MRLGFIERKDMQIILLFLAKCNYQRKLEVEWGRDGKGVGSETVFFSALFC